MAEQKVEFLTSLSGAPSTDGKAIILQLQVGSKVTEPFGIPIQDVPTVIGKMLQEAIRSSELLAEEQKRALSDFPQSAIPKVTSFALGPSDVSQHETMYIRFGILEIRVLIHVDQLTEMVDKLGRPAPGKMN
ncbi:hypothetical protein [Bradyrhizobium australafricanum]|uniref:hypothetical protein n=1 Tax=Bradyrhizobium australafricanum TaxID=2821406 RepID=UPI001CE35BB2|nr:hypothetical protein [Bradyrhizobium australafricanum]MCA6105114.1 hypothetical protein [Bradyrhizobium australafricanum]